MLACVVLWPVPDALAGVLLGGFAWLAGPPGVALRLVVVVAVAGARLAMMIGALHLADHRRSWQPATAWLLFAVAAVIGVAAQAGAVFSSTATTMLIGRMHGTDALAGWARDGIVVSLADVAVSTLVAIAAAGYAVARAVRADGTAPA